MKAYGKVMMVPSLGAAAGSCQALTAVALVGSADKAAAGLKEAWLQELIDRHPALLPAAEIEPALGDLVAVCREMKVPSGFIDNVLVTPEGGICLVETKLWRNPEARRAVIGQILDYAADVSAMDYAAFEDAVLRARGQKTGSLFAFVNSEGESADKSTFVDAVSRTLRLGRFLLLIVGDGITEGAERLAAYLQRHVGQHFTLALIEISMWQHPSDGSILILPRILARSVQMERAVIRIEGLGTVVSANERESTSTGKPRASTISEDEFFEKLAKVDATYPDKLKAVLTKLEPLGVEASVDRHMMLEWVRDDGFGMSLGAITTEGKLRTGFAQRSATTQGRPDLAEDYQRHLAALLPGAYLKQTDKRNAWRLAVGEKDAPSIGPLLEHADAWLAVMEAYAGDLAKAFGGLSEA